MNNSKTNQQLLQNQLILNALRNAKDVIREIYTNQQTGERDNTFGDNKELYELYHKMNEMCIKLADEPKAWYNI